MDNKTKQKIIKRLIKYWGIQVDLHGWSVSMAILEPIGHTFAFYACIRTHGVQALSSRVQQVK